MTFLTPANSYTWPDLITQLLNKENLTHDQSLWAMDTVMNGQAEAVELAGFLIALRAKGESAVEISGLADAMLKHSLHFSIPGNSVDIVGTGGDRSNSVNISTMAALVIAGAGLTVIKHGNRAASSKSGSADVLESLGISLNHSPQRVAEIGKEVGITFCFAQVFHPSMKYAAPARKVGVATAFNFLGPLTNPAQPSAVAVGVADQRMAPIVAGVFAGRGTAALVFRGAGGLDELAPIGSTEIWAVKNGQIQETVLKLHEVFQVPEITLEDLKGADATYNAEIARKVLAGEAGPIRDTVVMNAAAAIVADGSLIADSASESLEEQLVAAYKVAERSIDSGAAKNKLEQWAAASARS